MGAEPRRFARVVRMKAYLDRHAEELEAYGAGRVEFNFADGAPVKAARTCFDRLENGEVKDDGLTT